MVKLTNMVNPKIKQKSYLSRSFWYAFKVITLFVIYFLSARFGLGISPVSGFATLVWPPTGIALVALLMFGLDLWPAILLAAFSVNYLNGAPLVAALGIGVGNALEAIIGSYLLKRFDFQNSLERLKDVVMLVIFASLLSTAISATVGVTTLFFAHLVSFADYSKTWIAWWVGDMLGDLIIAPFLLVWLGKSWQKVERKRMFELMALLILIIAASIFIFSGFSKDVNYPSLIYVIFPLLIWLAIRFNPKAVASVILGISVIAILGTVSGFGPFIDGATSQTLVQLQIFMGVLSMTMLVLASVVIERRRTEALSGVPGLVLKADAFDKERPAAKNNKIVLMEWLRGLSVNKKLSIIIILIIFILLFSVGNFWLGMKIMSSIRSYVGGEGLWSKAQKEATNSLITYSISSDEHDYDEFLKFLQVNMGDKQARLELNKQNPDLVVVGQGFIGGGNSPNDVNDLIFLYRYFRRVSYMDRAIQIWTKGDEKIEELQNIGERMHAIISVPYDKSNLLEPLQRGSQIASLVKESSAVDGELTVLENSFSETLGEGSRSIKNILLLITIILSMVLGSFVLFIALLIGRLIIQVDRAKTEFVSMASHQLRTPTTAIKWYSQMLSDSNIGTLNEKQQKYVAEIYHGNNRMIKLINNLLSIARIEMGKLKITREPVDGVKLLQEVIKEQDMEIAKKSQKITIHQSENLPKLFTDPQLLSMILQNIVSNAVKYTLENGEITCKIKMENANMVFEIADNGIGIPRDDQKRVFEKLFRAANSMDQRDQKNNREGTGLGLYIVKEITDMLGGKVWFESELHKGTTFYLQLPLRN